MPKNSNNKAKQNSGSAKQLMKVKSGKDLGLGLAGQLGTSLIKGIVPAVVAAVTSGVLPKLVKMIPGPQLGNGGTLSVSAPAARGFIGSTGKPKMRTQANGNCSVSHREYVADLFGETLGFDLQFQFGINPGNGALFPWLSTVAQRFEMYKFRSLRICYESQCSSNSSGTIIIAIDYDATDPPPTSKQQMMAYKNAVRAVPWNSCCNTSASADLHRLKTNYILAGTPPADSDIKTYDIGNLFIAIDTQAAMGNPQAFGELYVEYDVELITPQISQDSQAVSIYQGSLNVTASNPLGDNFIVQGPLPVICTAQSASAPYFSIQIQTVGIYIITFSCFDNPLVMAFNTTNGVSQLYFQQNDNGTLGTDYGSFAIFEVINTDDTQVTFTSSSAPVTDSACFISIAPFSRGALPNANASGPIVVPNVLRARLGRRKKIPFL